VQACERARRVVAPHTDCCCCGCILVKSSTVTSNHSNTHTWQGHRLAKPHTSCQVSRCHVHACCSCYELVDNHASSTHRSRVPVRRQFSLPAYTRVTNVCRIFGHGNGGWIICGTAYTRVYTVLQLKPFLFQHHHTVHLMYQSHDIYQ